MRCSDACPPQLNEYRIRVFDNPQEQSLGLRANLDLKQPLKCAARMGVSSRRKQRLRPMTSHGRQNEATRYRRPIWFWYL